MAHSYGGYTTNLPLDDLLDGKAWIAFGFDGEAPRAGARRPGTTARPAPVLLEERQMGPRHRVLCSATMSPASGKQNGYHIYGDPWREERYS